MPERFIYLGILDAHSTDRFEAETNPQFPSSSQCRTRQGLRRFFFGFFFLLRTCPVVAVSAGLSFPYAQMYSVTS